jgi:hypothetical protein
LREECGDVKAIRQRSTLDFHMASRPSQEDEAFWVVARSPVAESTGDAGKWLVFVPDGALDESWSRIREATEAGRLGPASKAASARPNPRAREGTKVIVIYTRDASDREDIGRVLTELRRL